MVFHSDRFSKKTYETCLRIVHLKGKGEMILYLGSCSPIAKCDLMDMNFLTLPGCTVDWHRGTTSCSVREASRGPIKTLVRFTCVNLVSAHCKWMVQPRLEEEIRLRGFEVVRDRCPLHSALTVLNTQCLPNKAHLSYEGKKLKTRITRKS